MWNTAIRISGKCTMNYLMRHLNDIILNRPEKTERLKIIMRRSVLESRKSHFMRLSCRSGIQDMFPITEEYIEREYTIAGNHLMLTSEHTAREIERKARKVIGMLKRGIKFTPTQPDVMAIWKKLKESR